MDKDMLERMTQPHFSVDQLEREFILRGELEGFGQRRYRGDRVGALTLLYAGRALSDITYPAALESVLIPGEVKALVMTKTGDRGTIIAVLAEDGQLHVHPELSRMTDGVSLLTRMAFGQAFHAKLEGVKAAVRYLQEHPAGLQENQEELCHA